MKAVLTAVIGRQWPIPALKGCFGKTQTATVGLKHFGDKKKKKRWGTLRLEVEPSLKFPPSKPMRLLQGSTAGRNSVAQGVPSGLP